MRLRVLIFVLFHPHGLRCARAFLGFCGGSVRSTSLFLLVAVLPGFVCDTRQGVIVARPGISGVVFVLRGFPRRFLK